MLKFFCSLLSFILVPNLAFGKGVRTIEATEDTIISVKTALGYSTVLSFSTKPNSAILGDQDSFKLEYVGNSITLKPLIAHATSNLFVFTPYERFNITLKTGTPLEADYHLKLTTPRTAIPIEATATQPMKDHPYPKPSPQGDLNRSEWNGISLGCFLSSQVLGDSQQRVTLFEVDITSKDHSLLLYPANLGVLQGGSPIPLERISFNSLSLSPGSPPIHARISVLNSSLSQDRPISVFLKVTPEKKLEVTSCQSKKAHKKKGA